MNFATEHSRKRRFALVYPGSCLLLLLLYITVEMLGVCYYL